MGENSNYKIDNMPSINKKKLITEVGDLQNIEPYDRSRVLKLRKGTGWLYAFETEFGAVNLKFERYGDEVMKNYFGEDQFFLEGYNLFMAIDDNDVKEKLNFNVSISIYNKILKTCLDETLFFLERIQPKCLFVGGIIDLEDRKELYTHEQILEFQKEMQIKSKLYRRIIAQQAGKVPGYVAVDRNDGILIQRDSTEAEKEMEKMNRLDRKGLLENYISNLLKKIK